MIAINWSEVLAAIALLTLLFTMIKATKRVEKRIIDLEKQNKELEATVARLTMKLLALRDSLAVIDSNMPMKGQTIPSKVRAKDGFGRPT